MDLDQLWTTALKVLQIFEDTLNRSYASLRYDRFSQCPNCSRYSFLGEWLTPKELQKMQKKVCTMCKANINYIYLAKPAIGKNPGINKFIFFYCKYIIFRRRLMMNFDLILWILSTRPEKIADEVGKNGQTLLNIKQQL